MTYDKKGNKFIFVLRWLAVFPVSIIISLFVLGFFQVIFAKHPYDISSFVSKLIFANSLGYALPAGLLVYLAFKIAPSRKEDMAKLMCAIVLVLSVANFIGAVFLIHQYGGIWTSICLGAGGLITYKAYCR